jgi:hypothetical protein
MRFIHFPTFIATTVILIVIVLLVVSLRLKMQLDCDFKIKKRKHIVKNLRTGDIFAVAYGSKRANLVKVFTGSMWAHSAVIIDNKEKGPLVLEVARYTRTEWGIMTTPIEDWLDKNDNNIIAFAPYTGKPIDSLRINKFLKEYSYLKEEMFVGKWLQAMFKTEYSTGISGKKKVFCSELVSHFLQYVGVMQKKYNPHGYKPWQLLYGKKHLTKDACYGHPILVDAF